MIWRDVVYAALKSIGGKGSLAEIYAAVEALRGGDLPRSYKAIVRRELEHNSSDSESYQERADLFYSVRGIGHGIWGLRDAVAATPEAIDIAQSDRIPTLIFRILRDTKLAREIKAAHDNRCQICNTVLKLANDMTYAEAHHLKPLGHPHHGPDIASNIIVVCPNHHALLDYGAIDLHASEIQGNHLHAIAQQYIDYHNEIVTKEARYDGGAELHGAVT